MTNYTTPKPAMNFYPPWTPRFWHGMVFGDWFRLLRRNRFRVHPLRWGLTFTVTCVSLLNTVLRWLQNLRYGRDFSGSQPEWGPIFIIGHWRSGTTLLHELMVLDDRFAYPTTYECFAANHFLITNGWFPKLLGVLLPKKRPMDDMAVSFDHPQEDEFALISMGAPSPLLRTAFPNDPPPYLEFLDMEGTGAADLEAWKSKLRSFVTMQVFRKKKPLILKSPTHTGRIQVLAEMFPHAKFIHITRNPYQLFSSTRRLWTTLDEVQALQRPREDNLDDFVFQAFERMYGGFERQRAFVATDQICDLRYEDLIQDPVGALSQVYDRLQLGEFERLRPLIEGSMQSRRSHKTNRHELSETTCAEIDQRWAAYRQKYGYADPS